MLGALLLAGCGASSAKSDMPITTYVSPGPTRTFIVRSSSMEPALRCAKPAPGCTATRADRIVVQRGNVKRDSIIVFDTPTAAAEKCGFGGIFVDRVIGLSGETVHEDTRGFIWIREPGSAKLFKPKEPYLEAQRREADVSHFGKIWHVAKRAYIVMGDNRGESCDSRDWGSVPARNVIGVVVKIVRTR